MAPPAPDPAQVARAFVLRAKGRTYREIAAELAVSVETAHRWVGMAVNAEEFAGLPDRAAERRRDAATLDMWLARVADAEPEALPAVARGAHAVVALLGRRARLLGLDMPVRFLVEETPPAAVPDAETTAAIRAALANLDARGLIENDGI